MLILKVTFLGDTHHFQLRQDTTIPYLKESVMNKFRLPPIAFDLTYCDKEGDEVSLVGNNDLEILREDQR